MSLTAQDHSTLLRQINFIHKADGFPLQFVMFNIDGGLFKPGFDVYRSTYLSFYDDKCRPSQEHWPIT